MPIPHTIGSAAFYHNVIEENQEHFQEGNVITAEQLCEMVNIEYENDFPTPYHYETFKFSLISSYTKLNKILTTRGLYLKSHKYCSYFFVLGSEDAERVVSNYKKKAKANVFAGARLEQGVSAFGSRWNRMSEEEQSAVRMYSRFQE